MKWKRLCAWAAALALVLSAFPAPVLAAEGSFVDIEDTAAGGTVYSLSDGTARRFQYDVPEGGVTALIFFGVGCLNCKSLFQSIAQGALADDPRVNIVAVSVQDREATQSFADAYMGGKVSNIYYGENSSVPWDYARLVLGSTGMGTAFVLLITEENGARHIRWQAQKVNDGWQVQNAVDALLGGTVKMIKTMEFSADGGISFSADLRNSTAQTVAGNLYAAGYAGGRMTDLQSVSLELPANGSAFEEFTVKGQAAKLFYLEEGTLRPLAPAVTAGG